MPAYRVENYIERAVDSLLRQTFHDFELIIVDDGSPDATGRIADALAARDSRIRVIHQPNAGAPAARNRAMETAQGRYFFFMDADDWAEEVMLEERAFTSTPTTTRRASPARRSASRMRFSPRRRPSARRPVACSTKTCSTRRGTSSTAPII